MNGTPQGGIISPTLANFTLDGLEDTVLKSIYPVTRSAEQRKVVKLGDRTKTRISKSVQMVRYADDFVVLANSRNLVVKYVRPAIEKFLSERGLSLSQEKTKLFKLSQKGAQLDFLGYTFKYSHK